MLLNGPRKGRAAGVLGVLQATFKPTATGWEQQLVAKQTSGKTKLSSKCSLTELTSSERAAFKIIGK